MRHFISFVLLLFFLAACEKQEDIKEIHLKVVFKDSAFDPIDVIPDPKFSGYSDEWGYWYFRAIQFRFSNVIGLEQPGDWWCDIYMAYDDFKGPGRYSLGREGEKGKAWMTFYRVTEQISLHMFRLEVYPSYTSGYPFNDMEVYEVSKNAFGIRFHGVLLGGNGHKEAVASGNVSILKKSFYGVIQGHD